MTVADQIPTSTFTPGAINDLLCYLATTDSERITIATWCARNIRGKAGQYETFYARRLRSILQWTIDHGLVVAVTSVRGGTSYVRCSSAGLCGVES
jgi:hypothetical protein